MMMFLLATSLEAHSDPLDDLINASDAIVDQINTGILISGAAIDYAHHGGMLTNGSMSVTAHISTAQLQAYNNALGNMSNHQPYGNVQDVLEQHAAQELDLMNEAVDTFTDVVVDMISVVEVAEIAAEASTPDEQAEVQEYVVSNQEVLSIDQEQVDTYNQSIDDIETHANAASAFLGVAANEQAVEFLQTGAENNNTDASLASVSYDANKQWVRMAWDGTNNATAVYLNGTNFEMDFYLSDVEVLADGSETLFYQTSPTYLGYECFVNGDCEEQ